MEREIERASESNKPSLSETTASVASEEIILKKGNSNQTLIEKELTLEEAKNEVKIEMKNELEKIIE